MLVISNDVDYSELYAPVEIMIEDMKQDYAEVQTIQGACDTFDYYRKKIIELYPEHCPERNELSCMNTKLTYKMQDLIKGLNSTPSHEIADSKLSKPATTTESNQMQVATSSINSINIDSMTLQELAALQLQIAQRMNELLVQNQTAVAPIEVEQPKPTEQPAPVAEKAKTKKGAARVKRQAAQPVTQPSPIENYIAECESNKAKAAATPESVILKACDMKYADLRSFISKATKTSDKAKESAQSIARKYGAKSWATVGRVGYEEIYNLIIAK